MKKYFLTGLATLIPLAVTIYVVRLVVNLLTQPFIGMVSHFLYQLPIRSFGILSSEQLIRYIAQAFILIALFLSLLILGIVARWVFVNAFLKAGDRLLHRIPFVNKVYKTTKELIRTLFSSKANSFKQVVLVEFPHKGSYCLGMITKDAPQSCAQTSSQQLVSVFIPTAPNPTTGFMTLSPISELIFLDMKSEEAIKYVVSCGVIHPGEETD